MLCGSYRINICVLPNFFFWCGGGGRGCVHELLKARDTSGAICPPCFLRRGSSHISDSRSVGNSLASEPQGPACQGPLSCWDLKRLPLLPALLWALGIELSSSCATSPLPTEPCPQPFFTSFVCWNLVHQVGTLERELFQWWNPSK